MKTLYLDIFSGMSGDMFLGAMIDLGVKLPLLEQELSKLGVSGYHLHATRKRNGPIDGIKFDVHLQAGHSHSPEAEHTHPHEHEHEHEHSHQAHSHDHTSHHSHHSHTSHDSPAHEHSRNFAQIRSLISQSALSDWVKAKATAIFHRVAVAEGKIHGHPPEAVHFHEVGAIDSIVDIVGACVALEALGKPAILAASVVDGTGWVDCAHGRFPVPTAATLEILGARGIAISQCDEPHELLTPTGAAILAEFVQSFGPMQNLAPEKIGYGLGTRQNKSRPNVLRAILGVQAGVSPDETRSLDWETDHISVLETNLDDCNAEWIGFFVERAFAAGALDVFHTPVQMKKNRPGVLVTVLCASADADLLTEMLLRETSAFGVRRSTAERRKLRRETRLVKTEYGNVTVKVGSLNGQVLHATPEFESCKPLALHAQVALRTVYEAAQAAARQRTDQKATAGQTLKLPS